MALIKINSLKATSLNGGHSLQANLFALVIQLSMIVGLFTAISLIEANQQQGTSSSSQRFKSFSSSSSNKLIEPPLYVIQQESSSYDMRNNVNLGHQNKNNNNNYYQPSSSAARQWNNQKLTVRAPFEEYQHRQPETGSKSRSRAAKQIVYTDEPVPYYHSFKRFGFGAVHNQPHHFAILDDQFMSTGLYSSNLAASKRVATPTKRLVGSDRPKAATGGGTKTQASKTNTRRFEAPIATGLSGPAINRKKAVKPRDRANKDGRKNLVCYYGTWAVYRPDAGKFPVENIDPFLCTHVIYG